MQKNLKQARKRLQPYIAARAKGGDGWVKRYEDNLMVSGREPALKQAEYYAYARLAGHYEGLLSDLLAMLDAGLSPADINSGRGE